MKLEAFWTQGTWEREPWQFDVGASLNFARWGLGFTADYLGRHAPNGINVALGPLHFWATVWDWSGLCKDVAGE